MEELKEKRELLVINLREIFQEKNPRLYKFMPDMVFRWLDKQLHIKDLNEILRMYQYDYGNEFTHNAVFDYFKITAEVEGLDGIDKNKRYIVASNHPLGGLDGMLIFDVVSRYFGSGKFLVNDLLTKIPQLRDVFVPINKYGANSRDAVRMLDELYSTDEPVCVFPAGLASRKIDGKIQDLPWNKHFITKAKKYKRDVIPLYVDAQNSEFFYNLALNRKRWGIPWNIELLFLPKEMFKMTGGKIKLTFGKPIPFETFTSEKTPDQWAASVRDEVYSMDSSQSL
ncbi:MAG: 1-acyl-sn-glycerol-3-phosphate acyltransferase [Bacteroidales bacterium]